MPNVEEHTRENDILLGFLERPALKWLAAHMPAWVSPDMMTVLGVVASMMIFISYTLTHISPDFLWLANLGFILNWMGDSLDGTLARHRNIERPRYGFLIDHWVDAISTLLIFMGLGLSPYVDLTVASFGIIAYLLLSIMVYLITYVTGVFNIANLGFGPTEIRVFAILANTAIFLIGNPLISLPYFGATSLYTVLVAAMSLLMFIYFMINTGIQAHKLALLDEKRLERRDAKRENNEPSINGSPDMDK
jgi:archaetidylinositol phosphate synthase